MSAKPELSQRKRLGEQQGRVNKQTQVSKCEVAERLKYEEEQQYEGELTCKHICRDTHGSKPVCCIVEEVAVNAAVGAQAPIVQEHWQAKSQIVGLLGLFCRTIALVLGRALLAPEMKTNREAKW